MDQERIKQLGATAVLVVGENMQAIFGSAILAEHTISTLREDYSTSLFSGANEIRLLASQLIQQVQNTG